MTIVIAAGGTGGHLYPAVALAREFLRQDPASRIVFVGTPRGLETKVLAHEGFELVMVAAQPVMGRGAWRASAALLTVPLGIWQAARLLRARNADLAIGIGGYTSPPLLLAAFLLGVPRVILEPNAYPGLANKLLGPIANLVFLAFEAAGPHFARAKVRASGTPIRREFYEDGATGHETRGASGSEPPRPAPRASGPQGRKTLLVFGGSQGASAINRAMVEALPHLRAVGAEPAIVHQTGEADRASVAAAYEAAGVRAEVVPFLFEMPDALRAADLVVARAGAVTLAELAACGKPAVLIPLPTAIYGHQEKNARVLEQAGAAVVLLQNELTGERLARTVATLLSDEARLRTMGERSRALGRTDAAELIVRECRTLVGGRHDTNRPVGAAGARS
ncbi:MAG: undecaprenyldiphospho-muramoylpentapeptide beta-N-acetylglucosaminyltransferase [Nitrospirota bacterium]